MWLKHRYKKQVIIFHECRANETHNPDEIIVWSQKDNHALFIYIMDNKIHVRKIQRCPFCGQKLLPTFLLHKPKTR